MNQVVADIQKNRMYIRLSQGSREEMEAIVARIEEECRKLQSGFSCLTDISDYTPVEPEDEELIVQAQAILWQAGMRKVVRVLKSGHTGGHVQFEKASLLSAGYSAVLVKTIDEAELYLDQEGIDVG